MTQPGSPSRRWLVLPLAFTLYAINMTSGMYIFGLFLAPLSGAFGWSKGSVALGVTVYFVVSGVAGPFVGRLGDRYGHSRVVLIGVVMVGGTLLGLSRIGDLGALYGLYGLLAMGNAASGPILLSAIMARRYTTRRGLAMGAAAVGISAGGLIFSPAIQVFIDAWDWRMAFLGLGLATWIVGLPTALTLHLADRQHPVLQTSSSPPRASTHAPASPARSLSILLRRGQWLLLVAVFLQAAAEIATLQHQVGVLEEAGIAASLGSIVLGLTAAVAMVGRVSTGTISDRIGARRALLLTYTLEGLGSLALMGVLVTGSAGFVAPYLLLYGVSMGGCIVGRGLLVAESFDIAAYGLFFGLVEMVHQAGAGVGTWLAAVLLDLTGTYFWSLVFIAGAFLLCVLLLASVPPLASQPRTASRYP